MSFGSWPVANCHRPPWRGRLRRRIVGRGDHAQFVEATGDEDGVGAGRGPAIGHQDGDRRLRATDRLASGRRGAPAIGVALASKPQQVVDDGQR